MGSKVPQGRGLLPGGPPQQTFLFQFDVIDNIMCLDDVLGFINPESQMPNTVLLAREAVVPRERWCPREGLRSSMALRLERTRIGAPPSNHVTRALGLGQLGSCGTCVHLHPRWGFSRDSCWATGEALWWGGGREHSWGQPWPQGGPELVSSFRCQVSPFSKPRAQWAQARGLTPWGE